MINSLQGRLVVGTAIVIMAGMLLAGIAVYGFSRSALYNEFDESLRATTQVMALLAEENEDGVEFESASLGFEEFVRNERPSYYQLWHNGKILAKSKHLANDNLSSEAGSMSQPRFCFIRLPDGRLGRQISVTFRPRFEIDPEESLHLPDDTEENLEPDEETRLTSADIIFTKNEVEDPTGVFHASQDLTIAADSGVLTLVWERPEPAVTIVVARDTLGIDQPLETLRWVLAAVGSAVTAMSLGLLLVVVQRGLRPIKAVSASISVIDETTLQTRLSSINAPREIAPMVNRLNELLARLEEAFHRERDFSSNIAHELRTPLAGLRSTLEVYLSRDHDQAEYQDGLTVCLQICEQSENLVENLLSLARVEGNRIQPRNERFSLNELFFECWERFRAAADQKQLQLDFDIEENVEVCSDREIVRVILRNLISNAVSHSDRMGTIKAVMTSHSPSLQLTNTGNQISDQQLPQVFDRLWRGDNARAQTGEHFGLGLTLARRFAELVGCHLDVFVDDDLFRVELAVRDSER